MDRRQYLGLTGTSIVALLGGCSSSGSRSTATATDTATPTATSTATATGTPTPTQVAPTTTVDGDSTNFEISRPFPDYIRQDLMQEAEGYNPDAVGPYTEHFAETVLSQVGNLENIHPGTGYRNAVDMAAAANWLAVNEHGKNISPENSFLPTSMAVDNVVVNVVDANYNGPTTLLADNGSTSKNNILNETELEKWLEDSSGSDIESEIALGYADEEGYDAEMRLMYKDVVEEAYEKAGEAAIGGFLIEFGKEIPDFYPVGTVPARPQVQPHSSLMEYGQEQVVETVEEDGQVSLKHGNLNKVKGEMNQAIYENVKEDELAIPYVENGQVRAVGRPISDYDPSSLWASDDMIP